MRFEKDVHDSIPNWGKKWQSSTAALMFYGVRNAGVASPSTLIRPDQQV
jgi:hypothetical protein